MVLIQCLIDFNDPSDALSQSTLQVSLSGHLFDQFLINEALDTIEIAGGSFHLIKCELGQNADDVSYSELEVSLFFFNAISRKIPFSVEVLNC